MSVDTASLLTDVFPQLGPFLDCAGSNWLTLVLSGEIIGAVLAIKVGTYRKGILWLLAALATIWVGEY